MGLFSSPNSAGVMNSLPASHRGAGVVAAAIPLVERQLELVRARQDRLSEFAGELSEKLRRLRKRQAELGRKA